MISEAAGEDDPDDLQRACNVIERQHRIACNALTLYGVHAEADVDRLGTALSLKCWALAFSFKWELLALGEARGFWRGLGLRTGRGRCLLI
jgi:hypothetical protein